MTEKLGKLERVKLQDIWAYEDKDFTPWLARGENLKLLADAIGMELEFEEREKGVGPFSADILCKSASDGSWVVIENQFGKTDHKHLGQLLTYAAGLDAKTVVWVAEKFTDEHRAALNRLNDATDENSHYFGLEIELWCIDGSPPAPKFNIVAQPNDWGKQLRYISEYASEAEKLRYRYWQGFKGYIVDSGSKLHVHSGSKLHVRESLLQKHATSKWKYVTFSVGRSGFHIGAVLNTPKQRIQVELCIYGSEHTKLFFGKLEKKKKAIEREIGFPLEWEELPENKMSKIILSKEANPEDESDWLSQHVWLKETVERFDKTFRTQIKKLEPDDF